MSKLKYTIDVVLISFSLIAVLMLFNNVNPRVIAPLNNQETISTQVLFEIKNANYILIDDNLEFSSPEKIFLQDSLKINFIPGTYYWKVEGEKNSEARKLTIISTVDLTLKKQNDSYEVVNSGSEKLNVDVYNQELYTRSFTLTSSDSMISNGTKFIGGKI